MAFLAESVVGWTGHSSITILSLIKKLYACLGGEKQLISRGWRRCDECIYMQIRMISFSVQI
jgi:hypothetical protein